MYLTPGLLEYSTLVTTGLTWDKMDNCVRQLPAFHADIAGWFQHIEAAFAASKDLTDDQKYYAVIVSIPTHVATRVAPTLGALPAEGKYQALKTALLHALGPTRESSLHALEGVRYEGGRPSLLLQQLQALNTAAENPYSENMVRFRWLALLPVSLRVLLTASATATLQAAGDLADSIFFAQQQQPLVRPDSAQYANAHVNSVVTQCIPSPLVPQCSDTRSVRDTSSGRDKSAFAPTDTAAPPCDPFVPPHALLGAVRGPQPPSPAQSLARVEARLAALEETLSKLQPPRSRPPGLGAPRVCFSHRRFGSAARNCEAPCSWTGNGRREGW